MITKKLEIVKKKVIVILYISCPPTWDGWQCWEDGGRPGYTEYMECPNYIYFKTSTIENNGACGGNLLLNLGWVVQSRQLIQF